MAKTGPVETKTFIKETPDGGTLVRQVTSVQGEVEARFDGYLAHDPAKTTAPSRGPNPGSGTGKSGSSS